MLIPFLIHCYLYDTGIFKSNMKGLIYGSMKISLQQDIPMQMPPYDSVFNVS